MCAAELRQMIMIMYTNVNCRAPRIVSPHVVRGQNGIWSENGIPYAICEAACIGYLSMLDRAKYTAH